MRCYVVGVCVVFFLAGCSDDLSSQQGPTDKVDAAADSAAEAQPDGAPNYAINELTFAPDTNRSAHRPDAVTDTSSGPGSGASPDSGPVHIEDVPQPPDPVDVHPSDRTLSLFLSVGDFATCNRWAPSGCRILQVTWDEGSGEARTIEQIVGDPGGFSPSLSPNGAYMAFDRASGNRLDVVVKSLETGAEIEVAKGDKSNWRDNKHLAFGFADEAASPADRWADVGVSAIRFNPLDAAEVQRVVGAINPFTALNTTNCSADDPFTSPTNGNLVAFHNSPFWASLDNWAAHECPWMSGQTNHDFKDPQPVVLDLTAETLVEGQTYWRFAYEHNGDHPGCAHLAFSPNGERVLCTDQPPFHFELHTPRRAPSYEIGFNRVYGFELDNRDGTERYYSVRGAEPMFDHRHPADLDDISEIWDETLGGQCLSYYTKRAEFCGGSNQILASVYCGIGALPGRALFSRLMLIDFSDPQDPVYTDLTSAIEDSRGVARGSLGGFTGTCRVGPDAE